MQFYEFKSVHFFDRHIRIKFAWNVTFWIIQIVREIVNKAVTAMFTIKQATKVVEVYLPFFKNSETISYK